MVSTIKLNLPAYTKKGEKGLLRFVLIGSEIQVCYLERTEENQY